MTISITEPPLPIHILGEVASHLTPEEACALKRTGPFLLRPIQY
ncbi:MAG: hypothetical protein K940chlam2_01829 [Chlamydiae bacterium]|nr:hypothetical protein [Chlamydiota bacterium]